MLGSHVTADGKLHFAFHFFNTNQVLVAGNFSNWNPIPLEETAEGWWTVTVEPEGEGPVFYKFVANGEWHLDQFNIRKTMDSENSFLFVGGLCGHLLRRTFFSHALGREKAYTAYLPPSYSVAPTKHYPSLVLLPGLLDDEMTWPRKTDLEDVMDRLIGEEAIPEMIVLMPDKDDTMFHEEAWGAYGAYLDSDLRNHAEQEYRVKASGDCRAMEGLSLGGAWALRLAAWHPDHYISVSGLSCAFSEDVVEALRASAPQLRERQVRFRLACGDEEGPELFSATWGFGQFLRDMGLSCETRMDHGPHDWPLWRTQLPHSLAFHGWTFLSKTK